jgi:hypothetical protein
MALQEQNLVNLSTPTRTDTIRPFPGARDFEPEHLYTAATIIFYDNHLYRARYNFTSGSGFVIDDWEQVAINSVGFADIQGDITDNANLADALNDLADADSDLQTAISNEASTRQQADENLQTAINNEAQTFQQAISNEEQARINADQGLAGDIDTTNNILDGVQAIELQGAILTRVINGITPVAKNLLDDGTVFVENKTLLCDADGTLGKYVNDADSATVNVQTLSISPLAITEPTLLGMVNTNADLPLTVTDAENIGWNTPRIDDYAQVRVDETQGGGRVEWYITDIDQSGNITWGNPVPINAADYQEQTAASDAGRVLTGGATGGTFGESLGIDTVPTSGSPNLITSGAVDQETGQLQTNVGQLQTNVGQLQTNVADAENKQQFTFVIDSDADLAAWATNAPGNDYSRILIKAGTWTYNAPASNGGSLSAPLTAIDISDGRTLSVLGESGSLIVINHQSTATTHFCGIKGKINAENYCFFKNVQVQLSQNNNSGNSNGYGFYNCNNLTNCTGTVTGTGTTGYTVIGYGFYNCNNLTNCTGTGTGTTGSSGYAFHTCRTGLGCKNKNSVNTSFLSCYMEQSTGTTAWANTAAGGWNLP